MAASRRRQSGHRRHRTPPPSPKSRRGRRGGRLLGRARVDAVDRYDLKAAGRILQIADDCRALEEAGCAQRRQRRGVTEGVRAIIQRDEPVTLCRVEPLDRTLHRSSCERSRTTILVICHKSADATPWPDSFPDGAPTRPGHGLGALTPIMRKRTGDSQPGCRPETRFLQRETAASPGWEGRFRGFRDSRAGPDSLGSPPTIQVARKQCPEARISPPIRATRRCCSISTASSCPGPRRRCRFSTPASCWAMASGKGCDFIAEHSCFSTLTWTVCTRAREQSRSTSGCRVRK